MSLQKHDIFTLFIIIFVLMTLLHLVWNLDPIFAQNTNTPYASDTKNIIIKYCNLYADSATKGIDVIQDLIGAGILPSSYYGTTCQEETDNINHVNLTN
jgi:hypothetical protein